jgi:transcriptional/translational regulatory protein YebC/TACO1
MKNIEKLTDSLLREELHNMLLELGIIHISQEPENESVIQAKIKAIGLNNEMFESALYNFKVTSLKAFEGLI